MRPLRMLAPASGAPRRCIDRTQTVTAWRCAQTACLGVHLCHDSMARNDSGEELHTAAVTVYMLQRSMTWVLLLQPDKDNHMQALELGTNSSKWSVGCGSVNRQVAAHDDAPMNACTIICCIVTNRLASKNLDALRPTCCNGLLPLMGGDSQWPIRGAAAALLAMLQLRVVDPVRAKGTLCTVFPPAAVLPTSDLPGARKDFFRRLQHQRFSLLVQKQAPGWSQCCCCIDT